jgi:hypothetical protein
MTDTPSADIDSSVLVSFVTSCKGRLHHLQQTLTTFLAQSNAEVVVVDYGCPQGTAAWVRAHHPSVVVVEVKDDSGFSLARARNFGAAQARGRYLCFVDADMRLVGDLGTWVAANAGESAFCIAQPHKKSAMGTCVVPAQAFARIGGYDEAFRGWGGEDADLYDRLRCPGRPERGYPSALVESIHHGDEERGFGSGADDMKDMASALRSALLYRTIKRDMAALAGKEPELASRKQLMSIVKATVRRFEASGHAGAWSPHYQLQRGIDAISEGQRWAAACLFAGEREALLRARRLCRPASGVAACVAVRGERTRTSRRHRCGALAGLTARLPLSFLE